MQNKKKSFFWDTLLQSYCIQMWPFWQLKTWHDQHGDRDRLCVRLVEIMTHLTIPGYLRNSNYAIDIEGLRLIVRGCFGQHSQFQRCLYFHFLCLRNHFLANRLRDLMFGEPAPRTPCPICRFTNTVADKKNVAFSHQNNLFRLNKSNERMSRIYNRILNG